MVKRALNMIANAYSRVGLLGLWAVGAVALVAYLMLHMSDTPHYDIDTAQLLQVEAPGTQHVHYNGFDIYYDAQHHLPACVAYELTDAETQGNLVRVDAWYTDDTVRGCAMPYDYMHSGYDRGHMAPAADLAWNSEAMAHTFTMANVCPQHPALNSGAWQQLEEKVREWARHEKSLLVFTGPIVTAADTTTIGDKHITVPGAFYKIVVAASAHDLRALAFIYPNTPTGKSLWDHVTTIDHVERLTGINFLTALPHDTETHLESTSNLNYWLYTP